MKDTNINFIHQTANDYFLSFETVLSVYLKYGSTSEFYDRLEEIIKNR